MDQILACIDNSEYAMPVCDLAAWGARKLQLPIELLHVVQHTNAVTERHDLSGVIGLGVKGDLLEELVQLEQADSRARVERGRALLAAARERLGNAGIADVRVLHRHGGIVETILEREEHALGVVIGKRGASHAFASEHIGSKVERVVRASNRPILVASRTIEEPKTVVLAYDASPAARRALERCANSPLLRDLPVRIVMAGQKDEKHRQLLAEAVSDLGREATAILQSGRPDAVIGDVIAETPGALLVMGAYGHSPLRKLIVGSTTTAMIRTVHVPILLVR